MRACVCLVQDTPRNIFLPNQYITLPAFDLLHQYCVRAALVEDFDSDPLSWRIEERQLLTGLSRLPFGLNARQSCRSCLHSMTLVARTRIEFGNLMPPAQDFGGDVLQLVTATGRLAAVIILSVLLGWVIGQH